MGLSTMEAFVWCLLFLVASCKSRGSPSGLQTNPDYAVSAAVEIQGEVEISDGETTPLAAVYSQLEYLTGVLLHHGDFAKYPAGVDGQGRVDMIKVTRIDAEKKDRQRVTYRYTDSGLFLRGLVPAERESGFQISLPRDPRVFLSELAGQIERCAESHWAGRRHLYWYYWKIDAPGCAIPSSRLAVVKMRVTPGASSPAKLPRYDSMLSPGSAGRREVRVSLFWQDEDLMPGDEDQVKNLERELLGNKIRGVAFTRQDPGPGRESLLTWEKDGVRVVFQARLVESYGKGFADTMRKSMIEDDVFIFAGHSNYGDVLLPERLGITSDILDQSKQQIFIFAGCRTHSYYSRRYLDMKPGSLTVLAMANPSYGFTYPPLLSGFLEQWLNPAKPSWSEIIKHMSDKELVALRSRTYQSGGQTYNYGMWPHFRSLVVVRD
jgi:hypothetical protein